MSKGLGGWRGPAPPKALQSSPGRPRAPQRAPQPSPPPKALPQGPPKGRPQGPPQSTPRAAKHFIREISSLNVNFDLLAVYDKEKAARSAEFFYLKIMNRLRAAPIFLFKNYEPAARSAEFFYLKIMNRLRAALKKILNS